MLEACSPSSRCPLRESLREHIAALPAEHGEVLVLRHFEGLSRAEIAELLEVSESAVKWRLYEASRRLRAALRTEP